MKELSIEEKARAYDEALEKAKICLKDGTITSTAISYIETIFPELKESEEEKVRKTLVDFFQDWRKTRSHCWSIPVPDILAWLEKQKHWKPSDEQMELLKDASARYEGLESLYNDLKILKGE